MKKLTGLVFAGLMATVQLAANFEDGCSDDIYCESVYLITTDYGFHSFIYVNGHLYPIEIGDHSSYCECDKLSD